MLGVEIGVLKVADQRQSACLGVYPIFKLKS